MLINGGDKMIKEAIATGATVEEAIEKAKAAVAPKGMFLDSSVIAHPDAQICKSIL